MNRGYFLLELVVAMGVVGVLLLVMNTDVFRARVMMPLVRLRPLVPMLHYARFYAMAHDRDTVIDFGESDLSLDEGERVIKLEYPWQSDLDFSKKLGFKSNGNGKYSGSIKLKVGHREFRVSLDKSIGRIAIWTQ